jgi:hypothetical protein
VLAFAICELVAITEADKIATNMTKLLSIETPKLINKLISKEINEAGKFLSEINNKKKQVLELCFVTTAWQVSYLKVMLQKLELDS